MRGLGNLSVSVGHDFDAFGTLITSGHANTKKWSSRLVAFASALSAAM